MSQDETFDVMDESNFSGKSMDHLMDMVRDNWSSVMLVSQRNLSHVNVQERIELD